MKFKKWMIFAFSIVVCQLAGIIGSLFTTSSIDGWYSTIVKSSLNPPNWVFGPVWTILFVVMGISLYLVLLKKDNKFALVLFAMQLVLNIMWSIVFFGLHSPLGAFIVIVVLWFAILFTLIKFYKIDKWAGYLLIPYLLWVAFASILNYSIIILN